MRLKRFLSAAIAAIMVSGLLPSAVLAAQKEEGTVTASKFLQNTEPDEDGNYTVKMTIEGVQYTESTETGADVVLAVDTSGSMSGKVSKDKRCQSTTFTKEEREYTDWFGEIMSILYTYVMNAERSSTGSQINAMKGLRERQEWMWRRKPRRALSNRF